MVSRPVLPPGLVRTLYFTAFQLGGLVVGRRFAAALRELQRVQWLSPEELQARADARLARLLQHAALHVPFYQETYRRLGLAPDALRTAADLARLPIVSKAMHREAPPGHFLAGNLPVRRRVKDSTSGSTGEPFQFFLDREAIPLSYAGGHLFFDTWFGLGPFERSLRVQRPGIGVRPPPQDLPALSRLRYRMVQRVKRLYEAQTQERISIWHVDGETAETVHRRIEAFAPAFVHGYTSTLATIADELLQRDRRPSRPLRAVVTGAETMTPERWHLIEAYFGAPIIHRYGLRELGSPVAQNCPVSPRQFHVNTELVVWEILREDGTPADPGETGRVVLTGLHNQVMPFIRYDTGDLAVAAEGLCACGRGFPLVGPIEGRSQECVRTPSGKVISPVMLGAYLLFHGGHLPDVRQYQLVQEAPDQVRLLIVPAPGLDAMRLVQLCEDLTGLLGKDMTVRVEAVAEIRPEKSGKRPIIKQKHAPTP